MSQLSKRMLNVSGALALGALLAATSGCTDSSSSTTTTSSSGDAGTANECGSAASCRVARDCGGGFECRTADGASTGCCVKLICESDADCQPPEICDIRRGICTAVQCKDAECPPGQHCINSTDENGEPVSECGVTPPVDTCTVDVARFALRGAQTRQLSVTGYRASGAQVSGASFNYASSDDTKATVSNTGLVTGVATGTATITVTPQPMGTACTTEVTVYGNVDAANARAIVFDNKTGRPLEGVAVQLRKMAGMPAVVMTNAQGVAEFPNGGPQADILDISAFPANHSWVTYSRPGTNDVAIFVDPLVPSNKVAGVTGTFDLTQAQPPVGDIKLGLAAFSIAGALSDLNLGGLIGKTVPTDINIPSISVNQMDVPLPSGVFLKLSMDNIKERVDMYVDGPCTAQDPCRRVLWGLGGQVALSKIGPIISEVAGGTGGVDAGKILAAVLPFFRKFYHYAKGGFSLVDIDAPQGDAFPNFTQSVTVKPNYLLNRNSTWTLPALPALPTDASATVSGALVLTGSYVPGQGMVPLGVTAGLDECPAMSTSATCVLSGMADGRISCADDNATSAYNECEGLAPGDVVVDYAPPHDGLEAYRLATVAVALDVDSLGAGSLFTSVLVSFNDTVGTGTTKNSFPIANFLNFNRGSWTAATRTYAATSAVTGADFYRLNLDTDNKPWYVYFSSSAATFSVEVPPLPAGVTGDRVENIDIQAFKFLPGTGMPTSFTQLVEFNSTNFDNVVLYTGGFSTQECVAITPAVECTDNAGCENALGSSDFTCDTGAGVCVNAEAGVTVKGAGACETGTEAQTTNNKTVCSRVPACRVVD